MSNVLKSIISNFLLEYVVFLMKYIIFASVLEARAEALREGAVHSTGWEGGGQGPPTEGPGEKGCWTACRGTPYTYVYMYIYMHVFMHKN